MKKYLAMLVYHGQYIAMQFLEVESEKEAYSEACRALSPFSGGWVELVEVKDNG